MWPRHPDRLQVHLYAETGEEELSYAAIRRGAAAYASRLAAHGLQPGQTVAIMLPTGRDYLFSFFGILMAGGIPVPLYPPARPAQIEDHLRRHVGILGNCRAAMLITIPEAKTVALLLRSQVESLQQVLMPDDLAGGDAGFTPLPANPGDIAFLQYTSGSTGNPKGVVLTHANLVANIRGMGEAVQASANDVFVSWLPLYHDMGLIGAWFAALYLGFPTVLMSPLAFLSHPSRWLWAIHRHRGTLSGGPNFSYELCLKRIEDQELEGLDLSCWRYAFNGAEPVSPDTLAAFEQRFARYGLPANALQPVYGLAEASVGLAFPAPGTHYRIDRIERAAFQNQGDARPAAAGEANALEVPCCGRVIPAHHLRVVDSAGVELADRQEGRLQFKGPSATSGYFRNPEQTRKLFAGAWLDTGDLAYLADGELYLSGRAKDIIIRGGRNLYPYELEQAVGALPGIRKGCVAVFGSPDPRTGTERVIVLAETRETGADALEALRRSISDRALDLIGLPADDIVLAPPHTVLKTSSGKIRRAASREYYERGGSSARPAAVWLQLARLAWASLLPELRRQLRALSGLAYSAWVWFSFLMLAVPTLAAAALLRNPARGWRLQPRRGQRFFAAVPPAAGGTGARAHPGFRAIRDGSQPCQLSRWLDSARGFARARLQLCRQTRVEPIAAAAAVPAIDRHRLRRARRHQARRGGCVAPGRVGARRAHADLFRRRHLHPQRGPPAVSHGRLRGRGANRGAARAGDHPRHALGAARRQLVRAARRHRRHHRRAARAAGQRLERRRGAARCRTRRNPASLRRAGPGAAAAVGATQGDRV